MYFRNTKYLYLYMYKVHVLCEMIPTIKLIYTSVTSHSYNYLSFFSFGVVRTFKIYSLSNGKHGYNTVLFTIVTVLYVGS